MPCLTVVVRRILLLGCLFLPSRIVAQGTPEDAAKAFGDAMHRADWPAAARIMHPAALHQLRTLFRIIFESDDIAQVRQQLFGVGSSAEAAATPDTVLFARFLKATLSQQPGLLEALQSATFVPLGHVEQGADTVLVVSLTKMSIKGMSISTYDVMPFVKDGSAWRGLLKVDFTNMAAMLNQMAHKS